MRIISRFRRVPWKIIRIQFTELDEAARIGRLLLQGSPTNTLEFIPLIKVTTNFDCSHYLRDFVLYSLEEGSPVLGKQLNQGFKDGNREFLDTKTESKRDEK